MTRLLILPLMLAVQVSAQPTDPWLALDKYEHFAGSSVIAAAVTLATGDESTGFWVSAGVGLGKEIYDSYHTDVHTPSIRDFTADLLGAYVGAKFAGWCVSPSGVSYTWRIK